MERAKIVELIAAELDRAYAKHGTEQWGRHEFYAILKEEVDEVWDSIKADEQQERLREEIIQVAAMAFRYLETGDRYRERASDAMRVVMSSADQQAASKFIQRLAIERGEIVSSADCSTLEIAQANACGRMLVIDSLGFVLRAAKEDGIAS